MSQLFGHLLLGLSVLAGSAIPFVPTGELVSGAAAVTSHSLVSLVLIFVISWVSSLVGDTLMLLEVRLVRRPLQVWLDQRPLGQRVLSAGEIITRNPFQAVLFGRLLPGGRAPVIIALGLAGYPIRRFMLPDTLACALWAAIYAVLGSLGGQIAKDPLWGMVIAVAASLVAGVLVRQLHRFFVRNRQPRHTPLGSPDEVLR
jgi:membrane protein DedA with SNARE-associated domain